MKSVAERCTELQAQLNHLQQIQDQQEKAKVLGARRVELEARRVKLTHSTTAAAVLLKHGQLVPEQLPRVEEARQSYVLVSQRLGADSEALTTGRDYSTLLKRLDKVNNTLDNLVSTAWHELVRKHEGGDERFLAQVELVPGQAKAVAAIRLARAELASASAQVPVSEGHYQLFLSCSRNLQFALGKLEPADFPAEVLRFFKRAQSVGGAPLSLLTAEVRAWLERKGMFEGLRIRFDGEG